ncbi:carbon-nitrogen hydrolase family protein [Mycolicibacterium litorale]|nr:carbon-nitrogen hydrolase family protein [Mycolicibacterium litorale]
MSRPLPLALVQAPARSLDDYSTQVERLTAERPQVRLVVHPELHLCKQMTDAEPLDGPRDRRLAELAGDLGLWLAPGSVYERDEAGQVYNTAVVLSPEGRRIASYRKIFPWRPYETTTPGDHFVVFTMPGFGRLGLSICYDAWFPESTRHLAWLGAELVLNVVLTPTADRAQEIVLARANAIVNQVFVASVNAAAPDGVGRSLLVDPEGRVRVEAVGAEDTVLTDVIDLAAVDQVRRYGTAGLNRMWQQWRPGDSPLALPMYSGVMDPANWTPRDGDHRPRV